MLQILKSLFGMVNSGGYPATLVAEAIERAIDGTDPWLRGISGYQRRLRPAVIRSIDHVVSLVNDLPAPLDMCLASYDVEPQLKTYFMSTSEMKKVLSSDRSLAEFLRGPRRDASRITALMTMVKQEGVVLGAELAGDIVMRDVPRTSITFDAHRFLDPADDEQETRHRLMQRAFDHLLSQALGLISAAKSERHDLERRRSLLEAKLNLLQRVGWAFEGDAASAQTPAADLHHDLEQIEKKLLEIGGDDGMLEFYLDIVLGVLNRPHDYLWGRSETVIVDRLGIKRNEPAFDAPELTIDEVWDAEGQSLVTLLVALSGDEIRGLA